MDSTQQTGQRDGRRNGDTPLGIIRTNNAELRKLVAYALQVATTPYSVLIEGETGTGKEVFARGIHAASGCRGAFVPINCSAVPEHMFEAELFGARRGAYTGLVSERPGLFMVADNGTLFLDEVADLPAGTQAKLLRVLEDGEIRPIGGTSSARVSVRVLAATHNSLHRLVEKGLFRSDLYFRLSAASIRIPPIRDRPEDLALLIDDALTEACRQQNTDKRKLDPEALELLFGYSWPGNVRELKNALAMAALNAHGEWIGAHDLPEAIVAQHPRKTAAQLHELPFFEALGMFERDYMTHLLRRADGNLSRAARLSGLSRGTVRNKARQSGLLDGGGPPKPRTRVRKA